MKFFCFVAVVASLALSASALNCWICENQRSNQECMENGSMQQCQNNQQACQNEVRTDNQGLRITKRCKQAHACDNNFIQNPRPAWFPTQCNLDIRHTVCRCCCNTDGCNAPALGCLGATCDPPHRNPANGRVVCTDSNNDLSECSFTCNPGYELVGIPESTCNVVDEIGTWTSPAPTCRPTVCIPPQQAPFNGRYSCDNGNTLGSTCSFVCDDGYYLQGSSATVCVAGVNGNAWSNVRPLCIPIICVPPQTPILNGGVSCTNTNRLGSVCSFSCNAGFSLVGTPDRECVDDLNNDPQGVWTNQRPVCEPNVCVPPHVDPLNGGVSCSNGNLEGSDCSFSCDSGYALVGSALSSCVTIDGVTDWNAPAPVCQPVTCLPPMDNPANGQVVCSNSNLDGSECTFTCDANYALIGVPVVTCNDDLNGDVFGFWSDPAPICQPIICVPEQINPSNGGVSCSNSNFAGSDCTFTCGDVFALLGAPVTTCVDDGNGDALGVWTNQPPVCEPIICVPPHDAPTDGQVSCTNSNFADSACTFTCDAGFALVGHPVSTCFANVVGVLGEWSRLAPVCQRIICLPQQSAPLNGGVVCTDENREGSVCTFGCDRGYARVGSETTQCLDDGNGDTLGEWTNPAPTCEPIICEPPYDVPPANGGVFCTNDNFMDSVCAFSCAPAFALEGSSSATCEDDNDGNTLGVWSAQPPVCNPIVCQPIQTNPSNGLVSCSNENFLASECDFTCDQGFALIGLSTTVCVDDGNSDALGEWSSPAPTCQPIVCEPPRVNPANGVVECTNSNLLGSVCTTICDEAYTPGGNTVATCVEDGDGNALGVWSEPPAVCNLKTCDNPPGPPANGFRVCTNGNFRGSQCEFGCNDYHTRVGPLYTNCIETADGSMIWDQPSPVCNPNTCPDQGALLHGNYSCTDDLFATSTCTFECSGLGYKIYPPGRDQNTCLNDTAWDVAAPCCARDCPPFALMDAVFILDSSSSIGASNWPIMKNFTKDILKSFAMTEDSARLAVFRYNRVVDPDSQILLNEFTDINAFLNKFDAIPYDGSGTRTGNALNYTRNVIFKPENGDRPGVKNVAVIITDGRSQDPVSTIASQLRSEGVLTYALGIQPPRGALDVGQLNDIAGSPDRLLITEGSFDDLGEELSAQLATQICGDPCADNHDDNENLRASAAAAASRTVAP